MLLKEIKGSRVSASMWPGLCVYVWVSTTGVGLCEYLGVNVLLCWSCTILVSRDKCYLYMYIISTDVFTWTSRRRTTSDHSCLFIWVSILSLYLYWSIYIKPCTYMHTEAGEREGVYLFKIHAQSYCWLDIRWSSCNNLASLALKTWQFLKDSPLESEVSRS